MSPTGPGVDANKFARSPGPVGGVLRTLSALGFSCLLNFSKYKKSANFILTPLYNCGKMEYTVLW